MALTVKQANWTAHKQGERALRAMGLHKRRGVAVTVPEPRKRTPCTCGHTAKHHKQTGRCRRGCTCKGGIRE